MGQASDHWEEGHVFAHCLEALDALRQAWDVAGQVTNAKGQRWCPEYVILDRRVTAIEEDKFERLDDDLLEPPEDHDYRPVVLNQVLSLNIKKALLIMQLESRL